VAAPELDWIQFAIALAGMPDVVSRIQDAHRDDGAGRCQACTTPGRGTPNAAWPCALAAVAVLAAELAVERQRRA
jgi:hypothetical protein